MTILAFVYVPLNLATSIFGMNIQQLNNNGQPIWVFAVTAIIAFLLTFSVWLSVTQTLHYLTWHQQMNECTKMGTPWPERGKHYRFVVRVAILIMLLFKGNGRWAYITRAWIRILTNERVGAGRKCELKFDREDKFNNKTACDYICYCWVQQPDWDGFNFKNVKRVSRDSRDD